mmetsp:Transcript_17046/g.48962  ORF Transcript_17046/g.48962 Transcript_17046/m.48962 type:complete len:347 (-) Transcript_17046:173-1213(-)
MSSSDGIESGRSNVNASLSTGATGKEIKGQGLDQGLKNDRRNSDDNKEAQVSNSSLRSQKIITDATSATSSDRVVGAGDQKNSYVYSTSSNLMSAIEATNSGTTGKRKRKKDDHPTGDAAANIRTKNRRSSAKESRDRRKQLFEDLQMSVARLAQENRELKRTNETVTAENTFLKSQLLGLQKGGIASPSASLAVSAPPSSTAAASAAALTALYQNQEQQQLQALLHQLSHHSPIISTGNSTVTNPGGLGLQSSTLQQRLALLQAAQASPQQSSALLQPPQRIQLGQQLGLQTPNAVTSAAALVSQESLNRLDPTSKSQLLLQLISSLPGGSSSQQQGCPNNGQGV